MARWQGILGAAILASAASCLDPIHGNDLDPADAGRHDAEAAVDAAEEDTGPATDTGPGSDAEPAQDVLVVADTGRPDAAWDASEAPDAGWDASAPDAAWDASESPDVFVPPQDAGVPEDAGPPDTGLVDGSCNGGRLYTLSYPSAAVLGDVCLSEVARFQSGPCSGADGGACHLDSRALYSTPDGGVVESVVVGSHMWNYDGSGTPIASVQGTDLDKLSWMVAAPNGICYQKGDGQCRLETRAVWVNGGGFQLETVTAGGAMWDWSFDGVAHSPIDAKTDLTQVGLTKYSVVGGPCYAKTAGQCRFQTQAFVKGADGKVLEMVSSAGKLWVYDETNTAKSIDPLALVPRLAAAACQGDAGCKLLTHAFFAVPDGGNIETFSN